MADQEKKPKNAKELVERFARDELIPFKDEVADFMEELADFRPHLVDSIFRKRLRLSAHRYHQLTIRFTKLFKKYDNLDLLFEELQKEEGESRQTDELLAVYAGFKPGLEQHVNDIIRILALVDRMLTQKRTAVDFRLFMLLSALAVIVAVFATISNLISHL